MADIQRKTYDDQLWMAEGMLKPHGVRKCGTFAVLHHFHDVPPVALDVSYRLPLRLVRGLAHGGMITHIGTGLRGGHRGGKVLEIAQEPISLETPIGEEEDCHLGDFIEYRNVSPDVSRICEYQVV